MTEYQVILLGNAGFAGSKRELKGRDIQRSITTSTDKSDRESRAKRMNRYLSPGEKKVFKLRYAVCEIVDGKYTGK